MPGFVIRLLLSALGLWVAQEIVPGIRIDDAKTVFLAAFLLGLVNAVVRPIAIFLTFPITIVTLGLFLFVLNAAMLGLVASLLGGFKIAGFGSALLGSVVVSVTSWFASHFVGSKGKVEAMERR
jgi:putative membrane protein